MLKILKNMKKYLLSALSVFVFATLLSAASYPTVWLAGDGWLAERDSTLTMARGWGQMLPLYLDQNVTVQNMAKAGRSTRSYRQDGRWDELLSRVGKKDVLFIQFGAEDLHQADTASYASIALFEENLMQMIQEAEKKKLNVMLCTPVAQFYFHDGIFCPRYGAYPEAVRRVAKRMKVALIDLELETSSWLTRLGETEAQNYFTDGYLNADGAREVARIAARCIQDHKVKPLNKMVRL